MSVSSINPLTANKTLSQLYAATSATTSPASAAGITSTPNSDSSASSSVSSRGKLLSRLQQLSQSNPTEFKKVAADIARQLQAAAQQAGGNQGDALSKLASKFLEASQTGSLSPLQPKHHGHHGAAPSAASTAAAAYQQSSGQDVGSQISTIIGQVLTQGLGNAGTSTAA